jgi:ssDNA-binding Zn-finger/Zn-ribbon topoisomerase 1
VGESFLRWAARVTREGKYDLTATIEFIASQRSAWRIAGQKGACNWWAKIAPRRRQQGVVPQSMRHHTTKEWFTFPMFEVNRLGFLAQATLVEPKCPRCGGEMQRRTRGDTQEQFFGCKQYPRCRGTADAWKEFTVGGEKKEVDQSLLQDVEDDKEETKIEQEHIDPRETLIKRICELVKLGRKVVEDHGITLPIGYRTVAHLTHLAVILEDADDAWRLWCNGRLSDQEREKFEAAGMPKGSYDYGESIDAEPAWYHLMRRVVDAALPVMVVGGAGGGKTRFAEWYAAQSSRKLHIATGSDDVAGRELWVSRRDASGGKTTNILGPAAMACERGDVLLLDEVDGFSANSLLPLNGVLNGNRKLCVPVLGEIEVHEDVRIIAAANTNGRSKDRTYTGRNRLDGATLNRFAVVVKVDYEARIDRKVAKEILDMIDKAKEPKPEPKEEPIAVVKVKSAKRAAKPVGKNGRAK